MRCSLRHSFEYEPHHPLHARTSLAKRLIPELQILLRSSTPETSRYSIGQQACRVAISEKWTVVPVRPVVASTATKRRFEPTTLPVSGWTKAYALCSINFLEAGTERSASSLRLHYQWFVLLAYWISLFGYAIHIRLQQKFSSGSALSELGKTPFDPTLFYRSSKIDRI